MGKLGNHTLKRLLKKYTDGTCSEEEKLLVDHWYEILNDADDENLSEEELQQLMENSFLELKENLFPSQKKTPLIHRTVFKWLAAACLVATAVSVYLVYDNRYKNDLAGNNAPNFIHIENTGINKKLVTLEDGSSVLLEPQSSINLPVHFEKDQRIIQLKGDAFFTVTPDAERPFLVYEKNLVTRVLGTSFFVKDKDGEIEVSVRTGKVSVYEKNIKKKNIDKLNGNGVVIIPNQKVTYYAESGLFVKGLVKEPLPVKNDSLEFPVKTPVPNMFKYEDAPLAQVIKDIEDVYNIEIILSNNGVSKCPFTGNIYSQGLYKKLDVICATFQMEYEVKGTQILITGGKPCE